ncbi:MAG: MBOAT family protein [Solobacterium sp.]|nr:MBOAT family protein [Solobacterium sp.]
MVFSSLTFLFAYLPIVLLVYFLSPMRWRNLVLFIVSLFFYGWGEPIYVVVMVFSIIVNWLFGNVIENNIDTNHQKSKRALIFCIAFNLLLLGFFKYWDFLVTNLNALGITFLKPLNLGLPIGISFYTFQTMSYPIDLYRKHTTVQKSLISFGAYVCMFPQLIAGPIVRYSDIAMELNKRNITSTDFYDGIRRFTCGLAKKVLLANNVGLVWEEISTLPMYQSTLTAWLGIICFAFQIYFDFSGYSDMAIGLGRILGFHFLENFNYPYISKSITDFWRRWHMSLSYWFRDYVYIPLGGNRKGLSHQILNICIVWLLTGFWHGASWNFVLWGVFYGFVLILEKLFLLKYLEKAPRILTHLYTLFIVLIAWVLFAFTDMKQVFQYLGYLFGSKGVLFNGLTTFYVRNYFILLLVCVIACTPISQTKWNFLKGKHEWITPILTTLVFILCIAFIVDASYNPFLYFRF